MLWKICVDIGCGSDVSYGFNPRCTKSSEAILLDIEHPSHEVKRLIRNSASMHFVVADAQMLPLRDNLAHIVYMGHVLEHLERPTAALREIYRILKKNGQAHIALPNFLSKNVKADPTHRQVYNFVRLRREAKKIGFRHVVSAHRPGSLLPKPIRLAIYALYVLLQEELSVVLVK